MPELFIELFSEEIPARMQKRAEEDLARLLFDKFLVGTGHGDLEVRTFSGPRRLGAIIDGVKLQTDEPIQTRKGPKVGAPAAAIEGFLKSTGLKSIDQAQIKGEAGKEYYEATYKRSALNTVDVLKSAIPEIIRQFPWPKSMRSGTSDLQWVRPLHNICCVFDGREVKIDVGGVPSEAVTWGHRFHAPEKIEVKTFAAYCADLARAQVIIYRDERKSMITSQARFLCAEEGLELVDDPGLVEEVTGLAELPIPLLGNMDPAFLDLPSEVVRLSMRTHQKYFAVRDAKSKQLAPYFVTVANVRAKDGGKAIAAGNRRVLSARLNDARFFWETDKKTPLFTEERREKLKKIVFHQKLGSVWDKVDRVRAMAKGLCVVTGADRELVSRAADLCKMDQVTETVGEFTELEGLIGSQLYLLEKGANASIAAAIEDQYRPVGPNDRVPSDKVAATLALAAKLDTLVGFWAIDEKPTGSSDPFALRRAALGVIRILLEHSFRLSFSKELVEHTIIRLVYQEDVRLNREESFPPLDKRFLAEDNGPFEKLLLDYDELLSKSAVIIGKRDWENENREELLSASEREEADRAAAVLRTRGKQVEEAKTFYSRTAFGKRSSEFPFGEPKYPETPEVIAEFAQAIVRSLLAFLADRLKVQLRDQGKRHDLVDAVFALGDDDLVRIVARVEALDAFLKTEDGANLLAGYKRAANILAAEEKKGKWSAAEAASQVDASKLVEPAEKALHDALAKALPAARAAVDKEDFAAAMKALSGLRAPVDAFFDKVLVNDPQEHLRRNRLLLLTRLVEATSAVADFSKIEG